MLNPAPTIIFSEKKKLQNEKGEDIVISENVFADLGSSGAFSNQFIEGMKLLYEAKTSYQSEALPHKSMGKEGFSCKKGFLSPVFFSSYPPIQK